MQFSVRFIIIFTFVSGSLGFFQGAAAADGNGQYSVRGAGAVSCEVFREARDSQSPLYHIIAGWIDGYITARNQFVDDTYDTASFESMELITALLDEFCTKQPEAVLFGLVDSLTTVFARNQLQQPSTKIKIEQGDRSVQIYEVVVRRIQEKLSDQGFYGGPLNAKFDAETKRAFKAYQTSIGFNPTGFPDQLSLWQMFTDSVVH